VSSFHGSWIDPSIQGPVITRGHYLNRHPFPGPMKARETEIHENLKCKMQNLTSINLLKTREMLARVFEMT